MKRIRVFAPGTIANIGCGFDVMGLALDGVGDIIEATLYENRKEMEDEIPESHYDAGSCFLNIKNSSGIHLPDFPQENVVTPA
ncbi:MAG: hypothetical protein IKD16_05110, partial [Bacteroidales bacterium]|nr:hypothetical protein [Bacteroidales bacterium]